MLPRTKRNGGESSLQEVAEAWKKQKPAAAWSDIESARWSVDYAKRLKAENDQAGFGKPDPRNVHED